MKINFQANGVVVSSEDKSLIEAKLLKMKKYLHDEPIVIDVMLKDETSSEKGGIDQSIHLNVTFGKEKIFIKETDNNLMRAFAFAHKRLGRELTEFNKKRIDKSHRGGGRLDKV